jgi:ABC-type phosphate transport system substrate-binding protein
MAQKNGMKVNYQVLGSGAGIEQETIKISERQSGVVA